MDDMVWYGMVWYGMVWYGMVWYGMVRHAMTCEKVGFARVRYKSMVLKRYKEITKYL